MQSAPPSSWQTDRLTSQRSLLRAYDHRSRGGRGPASACGRPRPEMETDMAQFLKASRFLILLPILGLGLAAAIFFVFGGFGLLLLLVEVVLDPFHLSHVAKIAKNQFIFEV